MIQIEDKLVSTELFDQWFVCHMEKCHGLCCVYGDAGAPLEEEESEILVEELERIKPYMRKEGIEAVSKKGTWHYDEDGDRVTPLIGREECAYVFFDDGIARCAIESAYIAKATTFRKPVSCHLYPIRTSRVGNMTALNYHRWEICKPAVNLGEQYGMPVFRFVKEALIRAFGPSFYEEMERVYSEWKIQSQL